MSRALFTAPLVALCLGLAACGSDDEAEPVDSAADDAGIETAAEAAPDAQGAKPADSKSGRGDEEDTKTGLTIATGESQFGTILFDEKDRAVYLFDKEVTSESECYGDCAVAWPPVLTKGEPRASDGADTKLLGTTKRDDGTTQVTYDGRPLYYYVDDPPRQVLCHNVEEFGGLWLVVEPDGKAAA